MTLVVEPVEEQREMVGYVNRNSDSDSDCDSDSNSDRECDSCGGAISGIGGVEDC